MLGNQASLKGYEVKTQLLDRFLSSQQPSVSFHIPERFQALGVCPAVKEEKGDGTSGQCPYNLIKQER